MILHVECVAQLILDLVYSLVVALAWLTGTIKVKLSSLESGIFSDLWIIFGLQGCGDVEDSLPCGERVPSGNGRALLPAQGPLWPPQSACLTLAVVAGQ